MYLTGDSIVFETHGGRTSAIVISSSSSSSSTAVISKKKATKKQAVSQSQVKGESSTIQHTPTAAATVHASVTPVSAMVGSSLISELDSPGKAKAESEVVGKRGRTRGPVTQDVVEEKVYDSPATAGTGIDASGEVAEVAVASKRVSRRVR